MSTIAAVVAQSLNIDAGRITDGLAYQDIPEWDSFAHVQLMLALEQEFQLGMTNELMLKLQSVGAIKSFIKGRRTSPGARDNGVTGGTARNGASIAREPSEEVMRGLAGVNFDRSTITQIDGDNGRLRYRGYDIGDLAAHASFEETVWLLLEGELPEKNDILAVREELAAVRTLPDAILPVLRSLRDAHPMHTLRTAVSCLGAHASSSQDERADQKQAGLRLIARVPMLLAHHHVLRTGRELQPPRHDLPLAHDFLRMLLGHEPDRQTCRIFEKDMIVHADHSSNASAFAGRVAISTGGGMHEALTAALSVFAGPRHGGAMEAVLKQIDDIGAPENVKAYVRDRQRRNLPVMGFGHRVYRTTDPRMRHFRRTAHEMSRAANDTRAFEIVEALVEAMQPAARLGIAPNVDLYAGITYRLLGLPDDLATAMFAAGRTAGWVAQALEQHANNILIRPLLHYVGAEPRAYVALDERANTTPRNERGTL